MSKIIKMTPEYLNQVLEEFKKELESGRFSDGKINFSKTFSTIDRKATVYFTELAWLKMKTLVREFSKEVAWHGIAKRGEDESKDEYFIEDILVYPQEVTGATVSTDQEKYQMWLMEHDDEVFNNIRMQGHSHVNMGVTPSGVDTALYERILSQLDDDMFYIFMIWNKSDAKTVKIYDMKKNILFETSDVTVEVLDDGTGIESFLKNAKDLVVDKTYSYGNALSHCNNNYCTKTNENNKSNKLAEEKTKDVGRENKKRKGKRKDNNNVKNFGCASEDYSYGSYYDGWW